MAAYGTLVTTVGQELIARYLQAGGKLDITEFAVGDGGGAEYKPTQDMTALRGERWRGPVSLISISDMSPNVIVIEAMVPADVGGFTIREAGVFDAQGNLIGIMNTPQTEKVASGDGALTEQYVEMYLAVSSTAVFDLTVAPSLSASKEELRQHNEDAYAHLGLLAKIDGKADSADVPTLTDLDGVMEEHNKDNQAHGDIRTALTEKANQTDLNTVQATANAAMPKTGGTFTGQTVAQDTAETSKRVRNISWGTADPGTLAAGEIYCKVES